LRVSLPSNRKGTAGAGQFLLQFADAFGSGVQFGAEHCDFLIGLLESQELRNRWMHEESLAQWFDSLEKLQGGEILASLEMTEPRARIESIP
jgi:hypothetical protein